MQRLQVGRLDPVDPRELVDQQLTVGAEDHSSGPQVARLLQALDSRRVLRDVVGGIADAFADLGDNLSGGIGYGYADPGGAGIAPSGPITGDCQKTRIRRQRSHLFTPSDLFIRSSSDAESCSWQPWQTPSTSAAAPTPFFVFLRSS